LRQAVVLAVDVITETDLVPAFVKGGDSDRRGDGLAFCVGGLQAAGEVALGVPALSVFLPVTLGLVGEPVAVDGLGARARAADVPVAFHLFEGSRGKEYSGSDKAKHFKGTALCLLVWGGGEEKE
jgi:hypothetical protein